MNKWHMLRKRHGEKDPIVQAEIQEARNAYQIGDYVTIDEYIAQRRRKN